MLLVDDSSIKLMADHMTDGGVAEIYVEGVCVEGTGGENVKSDSQQNTEDKDLISFKTFYKSPSKPPQGGNSDEVIASWKYDEDVEAQG